MQEAANPATPSAQLIGKRTAIVIFHGVGQQNKYQTVSDFAAGLTAAVEKATGRSVTANRVLRTLAGGVDSILRLTSDGAAAGSGTRIDIIEYYYQPKLQRQVSVADVVDWLVSASHRIRRMYGTVSLQGRLTDEGPVSGNMLGPSYMMYRIAYIIPVLAWLGRGLKRGGNIRFIGPLNGKLAALVFSVIGSILKPLIVDFAGDVTAYTAVDPKQKLNRVRSEILSGSVSLLKDLLPATPGPDDYDQIIVAGHSLGSVVAYDTLSTLSAEVISGKFQAAAATLQRITGLITFGSPLDKIALYFWPFENDPVSDPNAVKQKWRSEQSALHRGMLQHFHGMRGLSDRLPGYSAVVTQPTQRPLRHVVWLNFFHPGDIVAGSLDAYRGVANIRTYADPGEAAYVADDQKFPGSHSFYWYDPLMHGVIIDAFLTNDISVCFGNEAALEGRLNTLRSREKKARLPDFWESLNRRLGA